MFKLHFSTEDSYCYNGQDFYFASKEDAETFAMTETANYEEEIAKEYGMTLAEYFEEVSPWWIEKVETTINKVYK